MDGLGQGLLTGAANALQQGLTGYLDAKKYNDEQEKQKQLLDQSKQLFQMNMIEKGYQPSAGGLLEETDQGKLMHKAQMIEHQNTLDDLDAKSSRSEMMRQSARAAAAAAKIPGSQELITDNMSAADIRNHPIFSKLLTGELSANARMAAAQANAPWRQQLIDQRNRGLDIRESGQALNAQNHIQGDSIVKSSQNAVNMANRGLSRITDNMTYQDKANVENDLAALIAGGHPAQGTIHEQQYNTAYGKVMNLVQNMTGNPQDAVPAGVKQKLKEALTELRDITQKAMNERVKNLSSSAKAAGSGNKHLQNALNVVESQYQQPQSGGLIQTPTSTPAGSGGPTTTLKSMGMSREQAIKSLMGGG